jgi:hypothetical protein
MRNYQIFVRKSSKTTQIFVRKSSKTTKYLLENHEKILVTVTDVPQTNNKSTSGMNEE